MIKVAKVLYNNFNLCFLTEITDVTKQKDLSGFYRHLYRQQLEEPAENEKSKTVPEDKLETAVVEESGKVLVKEKPSPGQDRKRRSPSIENPPRHRSRSPHRSHKSRPSPSHDERRTRHRSPHTHRRKDRSRSHDRERHRSPTDYRNKQSSSRRSSRSYDRYYKQKRSPDRRDRRPRSRTPDRRPRSRSRTPDRDRRHRPEKNEKENRKRDEKRSGLEAPADDSKSKKIKTEKNISAPISEEVEEAAKKKSLIWEKRTVGTIFDEALARYFARKQANTLQASIVVSNA